jgi:RNA polymerase sigma-70 factor (ECF subfamily)
VEEIPLVEALRAALPSPRVEATPARELELALRTMIDEARHVWPGLAVTDAAFVSYLAARIPEGALPAALRELHVDLYLACGCVAGDPAAVAAFQRTIVADLDARIVPAAAERLDELRQLVIEKALVADGTPRIATYRGRGPLHAWVRVTAVRISIDLVRAKPDGRSLADASLDAVIDTTASPELLHVKTLYKAELKRSIETAAAQLSARERNLLRYSLLDGLGIDELAALYHVHRATAARWLVSARDALGAATKRDLTARLGLQREELVSLMRVVESQLEISWSRFRR